MIIYKQINKLRKKNGRTKSNLKLNKSIHSRRNSWLATDPYSEEFPFHSEIESLWNRWRVLSDGGMPKRWPWIRPMSLMVLGSNHPKFQQPEGQRQSQQICRPQHELPSSSPPPPEEHAQEQLKHGPSLTAAWWRLQSHPRLQAGPSSNLGGRHPQDDCWTQG